MCNMDAKFIILFVISTYTVLLIGFLIKISSSPTILARPTRHTTVARETAPIVVSNSSLRNITVILNVSNVSTTLDKNISRHWLPVAMTTTEPQKQTRKHYVSCKWHFLDGIGNQMFQYASVYGIGRANNLTLLMPEFIDMGKRIFSLSAERTKSTSQQPGLDWKKHWTGQECCKFHQDTMVMYKTPGFSDRDIEVRGYRQSWKYFKDYEDEIRREFTFQNSIQQKATTYLKDVIRQMFGDVTRAEVTVVSIHARRGDMISESKQNYGQVISNATYFSRAIDYFNSHLQKSEKLMYIVFSDNIAWCMENISRTGTKIVYSQTNSAEVDLAVMGQCNHSIMSIGTFGWWGAWLAGGTTVYEKGWPRPGSRLSKNVNKEDYFYPSWIPL